MSKHALSIILAISLLGAGCSSKKATNLFTTASNYQEEGSDVLSLAEYEKLAAIAKTPEHQFWALLQVGLLKEKLGHPISEIEDAFRLCHTLFPQRAEGAYYLSKIYHKQNRYLDAYQLEKQTLSQASLPEKESSFALSWIYEYGLLFQLSLSTYYIGLYQESLNLCDQLLELKDLPTNFKEQTVKNRKYPEQILAQLKKAPENLIFSLLRAAKHKETNNLSKTDIIADYCQAAKIAPNVESYFYLSKYYIDQGMHEEAYETALKGKNLLNAHNCLILEPWVHEYGMLSTYAYSSWKLGKFEEAVKAVETALQSPTLSSDQKERLKRSLFYYQSGVDVFELAQSRWETPPWEETK